MIDRRLFFEKHHARYGSLDQSQVTGLGFLLEKFEKEETLTPPMIAYILATIKHETAHTYQPIVERGSYKYFGYLIGKLGIRTLEEANRYKGRGYVQITGKVNYKKFGDILGNNLYINPELALDPETAYKIIVKGMYEGLFTGRALPTYFNENRIDPINARSIVNGKDRAYDIAEYYNSFINFISEP